MTTDNPIVYLNGQFVALNDAKVPVLDRGFIFGDGVYEVIPVFANYLFRFHEHIQRLQQSMNAIRLSIDYSEQQWRQIIEQLLEKNGSGDWSVYLHLTRGVARRDHAFPGSDISPTVFIMCNPLIAQPEAIQQHGIAAIILQDNRWLNCQIKAISLLPNILLRQQAHDQQAQEAILIRDDVVTEGAASNVFIVSGKTLITPPKSNHLLPGVTRDLVVFLAREHHIDIKQQSITEQQLKQADEIWLTSSTKEILAVTRLNGVSVGNGKPGPLWSQMMNYYQHYKQLLRQGGSA